MSREDMLRELELLPIWQLRQPLPMQFKVETPATDKSEQAVTEPVVKEQAPPVAEMPVIEIAVTDSAALELSNPVSSTLEPAPSVQEPVLEQALPLPLRLLLSEDNSYAFLIEPYAAESDAQQIETLLKNMIRAMQASCRVDVTDSADKFFAMYTPKLMISLGAEPANRLSGKTHTLDEWRNIQQENPPLYEQIPLIVTYHPAHLLANTADKALAWRDLCAAMKLVQNL